MAAVKRIACPIPNGSIQVQYSETNGYFTYIGGYTGSNVLDATEDNVSWPCPLDCTIDKLRGDLDTAVVAGTVTLTLTKNGVDTALTATISAGTVLSDTTHSVHVNKGDRLSYHFVTSADATTVTLLGYGTVCTGDNAGEFPIGGNSSTIGLTQGSTRKYLTAFAPYSGSATRTDRENWIPVACTIKHYYVRICGADGADEEVSLYVNGSQVAASVFNILAGNESGNKQNINQALAVGDRICASHVDVSDPAGIHTTRHGICLLADTDGESWFASHTTDDLNNAGTTEYLQVNCSENIWRTTRRHIYWPVAVTLSNFRVDLTAQPGTSKSYTLTTTKGGVAGNEVNILTGTAITATDITHTDVYAAGNYMDISNVSAGTPTLADAFWAWKMTTTPVDMPSTLVVKDVIQPGLIPFPR